MMNSAETTLIFTEELYAIKTKAVVVIGIAWNSLKDEDQVLLGKILSAVKLPLAAVRIVEKKSFSGKDFASFSPEFIISFGSTCLESPKLYEMISVNNYVIINADALDQLDDPRKKNLWNALRLMFKV